MGLGIDGEGGGRGRQGGQSCRQILSGHQCASPARLPPTTASLRGKIPFSSLFCFVTGGLGGDRTVGGTACFKEVYRNALLSRGAAAEGREPWLLHSYSAVHIFGMKSACSQSVFGKHLEREPLVKEAPTHFLY